jgi:hypothetical protein
VDKRDEQRLLTALIDYFESGTREADAAAKAVLAADGDFDTYWRAEIERFQKSVLWTGLRGPEAELLATGLRQAAGLVVDGR